jgi:predicted membrane protein
LFYTLNLGQATMGTVVPLLMLGLLQLLRKRVPEAGRKRMYFSSAMLILLGVLAMRWNVVIGGQLFSKSLRGVMSYKMEFAGLEGWLMGAVLLSLPFIVLTVMIKLFLSEQLPVTASLETKVVAANESNFGRDADRRVSLEAGAIQAETESQLKT